MIHTRLCLSGVAGALFALALALLASQAVFAHGAVSMEGDKCVMKVGAYKVHFTGYAPETRPSDEYCEDIPDAGKAVIAFDHVDKILHRMAMSVRILRDDRNLGSGAQYEQLGGPKDIEAATLLYKAPEVYPRGNTTVELNLPKGRYIGLVTMDDPETKQHYVSVFPFAVGYGAGRQTLVWVIQALFGLIATSLAVYFLVLRPHYLSKPPEPKLLTKPSQAKLA